eukprot:6360819-Pyramimonas_sp.AAC.1
MADVTEDVDRILAADPLKEELDAIKRLTKNFDPGLKRKPPQPARGRGRGRGRGRRGRGGPAAAEESDDAGEAGSASHGSNSSGDGGGDAAGWGAEEVEEYWMVHQEEHGILPDEIPDDQLPVLEFPSKNVVEFKSRETGKRPGVQSLLREGTAD